MGDKNYMPTFDTEEEYEQYFKREIELCNKHRDANGVLTFNSQKELTGLLDSLFEGTGITYHLEVSE